VPFKVIYISNYVPSSVISVFSVVKKSLPPRAQRALRKGFELIMALHLIFYAITHILYGG